MFKSYTYKLIKKEEQNQIEDLWHYCFEKKEEAFFQWFFSEYFDYRNVLAVYDAKEKIVACLHLIPYQIVLREKVFFVSYVVGVSSLPEVRGQAIGSKMLQEALLEMQKRKHFLSLLMPFQAGFYYPFQWELCYWHYRYKLKINELKNLTLKDKKTNFEPINVGDLKQIKKMQSIYGEFVKGLNGYVLRNKETFQNILNENYVNKGFAYLITKGEESEGYIIYVILGKTFIVVDWAYINITAQKKLIAFIYSHFSTVEDVEWQTPLNGLIQFFLQEPKEKILLHPFMSARITDIKNCLESLSYPLEFQGKLKIAVEDKMVNNNNRHFCLNIKNGKAKLVLLKNEAKEDIIKGEIGAWTQLVFGALSVWELFKLERIKCDNVYELKKLDFLFPKQDNYCNEFF